VVILLIAADVLFGAAALSGGAPFRLGQLWQPNWQSAAIVQELPARAA